MLARLDLGVCDKLQTQAASGSPMCVRMGNSHLAHTYQAAVNYNGSSRLSKSTHHVSLSRHPPSGAFQDPL